ncbi:DUF1330 domain-containing protein [Marivita sp. S2033]|uniref:DUF1330 domain-containing protein n=1 Tax=Marivita sp. S2033 TaxID=3373187 RepID=UPI003982B5EC
MPGYMIFEIDITDRAAWDAYREVAGPVMAQGGGRFLINSTEAEPLEGDWTPPTISVVEFPSIEAARAFYNSPAYQATIPMRQRASRGRGILVDWFTAPGAAKENAT